MEATLANTRKESEMLDRLCLVLCCVCAVGLTGCGGSRLVKNSEAGSQKTLSDSQGTTLKYSLAQLQERDGQAVEAKQTYSELLEAEPDNAVYNHRYGIVLCQLGEYEEGIEFLRIADAASPNDVDILNDLGFACMVSGKNEAAVSVLETALEAHPRNERATNNLAMAHGYLGEFGEAFSLFQQIMTEAEAMSNLGYVAIQTGRKEFAVEFYSRALDLNPELDAAKEALVQLADLSQRIEHRKSIVAAGTQTDGGVVHASATAVPGAKEPVRHAR